MSAGMPESYVSSKDETFLLLPPAWVVCKGFSVSVLSDAGGDMVAETTEASVSFALDGLRIRGSNVQPFDINKRNDTVERRKLLYTDCPDDKWAGIMRPDVWVDEATHPDYGTCVSELVLDDTLINAQNGKYLIKDGIDNALGYSPSVGHYARLKHNLCQTVYSEKEKKYVATKGESLTVTVNDEFDRAHEISDSICDDETCRSSAFVVTVDMVPTAGDCAVYAAPPHPRLFVSDHGFLWGPVVHDKDKTLNLSQHANNIQAGDPYNEELTMSTYVGVLPQENTYGTERASPNLKTTVTYTVPTAFYPITYERSTTYKTKNVSVTSNGARARGALIVQRDTTAYATSGNDPVENRPAYVKRAIMPVFVNDMYDLHVAESNALRASDPSGAYVDYSYSYATSRSWRGFARSAATSAMVAVQGTLV
ncbi:hypothetical protein CYMTET_5065 [Cymbomonas tetramitiformis]|uniref:Uncharacterized protein n=1 Tax=Cymbomonas tetramitiformis TaxID=36881 RepID=A0AAE0H067_9CHLO|nr:hypothetical protein CYMTET_5065 [Cymbomonas tetramitiformis]